MSRAFVKEDVDPPERSGRKRTASGLPPRALNYMTAHGAAVLRAQLASLPPADAKREDIQAALESATIVEPPEDRGSIAFGADVTLRDLSGGELRKVRIVGVDEVEIYPDAVTWISPTGKALLAAEVGDRVVLEEQTRAEIIAVDYSTPAV